MERKESGAELNGVQSCEAGLRRAESATACISDDSLAEAAKLIKAGELVVIPTDTVLGIVCNPFDSAAIEKLYEAKKRPKNKALQVLLASIEDAETAKLHIPQVLKPLCEAFLPGPFSPVLTAESDCKLETLKKADNPANEESNVCTQAVRVPDFPALTELLKITGPLAASSANISGCDCAENIGQAVKYFGDKVSLYLYSPEFSRDEFSDEFSDECSAECSDECSVAYCADASAAAASQAGSRANPPEGTVASTVIASDGNSRSGIKIIREGAIEKERIYSVLQAARNR